VRSRWRVKMNKRRSHVSTVTGLGHFFAGSKILYPANSGTPFSAPSRGRNSIVDRGKRRIARWRRFGHEPRSVGTARREEGLAVVVMTSDNNTIAHRDVVG